MSLLKELYFLLNNRQRRGLFFLQILMVFMAISQIFSIASIFPFMSVVGNPKIIYENGILLKLYQYFGFSEYEFIFFLGLGVLLIILLSSIVAMYTTWRLSFFSNSIGTEFGNRLYLLYMKKGWLFHAKHSSPQLVKNISSETRRVNGNIIKPIMTINVNLFLAIFIITSLLYVDYKLTLLGLFFSSLLYFFFYKSISKKIERNGSILSDITTERFRLMNEGFGGIRDILVLGRDEDYLKRFFRAGEDYTYSQSYNSAIAEIPKYFAQFIAFGLVIVLMLYLLLKHEGDLGVVLPLLTMYTLAMSKLLPAFQAIYSNIAKIKGALSAFSAIKEDLKSAKKIESADIELKAFERSSFVKKIPSYDSIILKNVSFSYPMKNKKALVDINIEIKDKSVVGIVGPSGSGKSTFIDILLGLITPQAGKILVDSTEITEMNRRAWQDSIGFVPQSIFLSEGSISENVAFGLSKKDINLELVVKALNLAHLGELIQTLDKGIHTKVGERGVQLSGGQRQRVGIARALYHEASVLIFDEATSALDGITEKMIMEAIHDFSGQKTIIMVAHRLKTVKNCDHIFFIDDGEVVDQGTYQELIEKNERFKQMAAHA